MTQVFPDTPPETERVLFTMLHDTPPWRKLEMVAQLNQAGRELALAGLRTRFPTATQNELHRRLAAVLLGDDLAAREKNWRAFATSPEWKKLSSTPGLSDAEIVSNISNALLTPLAGSVIR